MNNQEQNQSTPSPATDVDEVAKKLFNDGLLTIPLLATTGAYRAFTLEDIQFALLTYGEKLRGEVEFFKAERDKEHAELIRWMVQTSEWCEKHQARVKDLQSANEELKRIADNTIQELEKCNDLLKNERRMYENASKEREQLKVLIVRKDEELNKLCSVHDVKSPIDQRVICQLPNYGENVYDIAKEALSPTISSSLVEDKERLDWYHFFYTNPEKFTIGFCEQFYKDRVRLGIRGAIDAARNSLKPA